MELVDLEVEADQVPKCGVAPISIHDLLIRFVGFVVFLAGHVSTNFERLKDLEIRENN